MDCGAKTNADAMVGGIDAAMARKGLCGFRGRLALVFCQDQTDNGYREGICQHFFAIISQLPSSEAVLINTNTQNPGTEKAHPLYRSLS